MPSESPALLQLDAVNYTYRALPALRDINWCWREGEQWACVGPNGAGKSTLAGLLSGQLRHGSGELQRGQRLDTGVCSYVCFEQQKALCDRDHRLDDSEFRSDARDPGTTVAAALGRDALDNPAIEPWLDRLRIRHILDRGIRFISTGEMRKTLLLRAILQRPDLLILDNPLDGLDRASQQELQGILQELSSGSFSLLLLLRSLDELPEGVSHLLVLEQGQVLAAGARHEVLANDAVKALMQPPPLLLSRLPAPASRAYQLDPTQALLALRNVSVSYGDTVVLEQVNWTFRADQHCNLAGPNGCGKTTLLSLVTGDNQKAYGQDITLFGIPRGSGESVWDIKQKFGQVSTQLHLNHARGMRVLEVVISGFFDTVGLYDDWGDSQAETARGWLDALGLGELAMAPFDTLSFGIQRMVLLARAMVKSPAILILDEPCLGLDGHHTRAIIDAIDHIADLSDTRVIYVSHSVGQMPKCINQWLEFVPEDAGYRLQCRESAAD